MSEIQILSNQWSQVGKISPEKNRGERNLQPYLFRVIQRAVILSSFLKYFEYVHVHDYKSEATEKYWSNNV